LDVKHGTTEYVPNAQPDTILIRTEFVVKFNLNVKSSTKQ